MTDREDEAKPYDQRMLELLEEATDLLTDAVGQEQDWLTAVSRWCERYAKLLADWKGLGGQG